MPIGHRNGSTYRRDRNGVATWTTHAAYFAVAHYRYEGSGPLLVAAILSVLTWLAALGYPKLDKTGFAVASSS